MLNDFGVSSNEKTRTHSSGINLPESLWEELLGDEMISYEGYGDPEIECGDEETEISEESIFHIISQPFFPLLFFFLLLYPFATAEFATTLCLFLI